MAKKIKLEMTEALCEVIDTCSAALEEVEHDNIKPFYITIQIYFYYLAINYRLWQR